MEGSVERTARQPTNGQATIVDVAKLAGLSKSTVSNVIRGAAYVAPETRQRVLEAIEELGYRRNAAARSLVRRRTEVLGVMAGDFNNPFHPEMAALIEREAAARGHTMLLAATGGDPRVETARVQVLLEHRVSALIVLGFSGARETLRQVQSGPPAVFVGFQSPHGASVSVNEQVGASLAVTHLVNRGHRRIGYVSTTLEAEARVDLARLEGYRRVLTEHGIAIDDDLILRVGPYTGERDVRSLVQEYLGRSERPTAIFAASDYTGLEVIDCADELSIDIPDELSLVGFDDIAFARMTRISLTTVAQPLPELARRGVEAAIAANEGKPTSAVLLTPRLVVRTSTGPPPM